MPSESVPARPSRAVDRLLGALAIAGYLIAAPVVLEALSTWAWSVDEFRSRIAWAGTAGWRALWLDRDADAPGVAYSFDAYHERRGWALEPNLHRQSPWGPDSLHSTASGFRGTREPGPETSTGKLRILALGDSFTFGEEVRDEEAYPAVLERLLPATEVVNLGVHGYGHGQMLLYLEEAGESLEPDLVLVGFVGDDMRRTPLAFRDYAKPRYVMRGENLILTGVPVPTPEEIRDAPLAGSRFVTLSSLLKDMALERAGVAAKQRWAVTGAILDRVVEVAYRQGAVTVFAYLPQGSELDAGAPLSEGQEFFAEYCRDRAALCVDLTDPFRAAVVERPELRRPGHWNAEGHRLVARGIQDDLDRRDLLRRIAVREHSDDKGVG